VQVGPLVSGASSSRLIIHRRSPVPDARTARALTRSVSLLRFNGLVFNDNGTLRMDCAQIDDGVAE